jgi:hypothetical protein
VESLNAASSTFPNNKLVAEIEPAACDGLTGEAVEEQLGRLQAHLVAVDLDGGQRWHGLCRDRLAGKTDHREVVRHPDASPAALEQGADRPDVTGTKDRIQPLLAFQQRRDRRSTLGNPMRLLDLPSRARA